MIFIRFHGHETADGCVYSQVFDSTSKETLQMAMGTVIDMGGKVLDAEAFPVIRMRFRADGRANDENAFLQR